MQDQYRLIPLDEIVEPWIVLRAVNRSSVEYMELRDSLAAVAVVTGTLSQWRDAVASGCSKGIESSVRHCFNKLYGLFTAAGLNVWGDFQTRPAPDQTFLLLEDKRTR